LAIFFQTFDIQLHFKHTYMTKARINKKKTSVSSAYLARNGKTRKNIDYDEATYEAMEDYCSRLYPGANVAVKTLVESLISGICLHPQGDTLIDVIINQKSIRTTG
jgi:hypothetical protein